MAVFIAHFVTDFIEPDNGAPRHLNVPNACGSGAQKQRVGFTVFVAAVVNRDWRWSLHFALSLVDPMTRL